MGISLPFFCIVSFDFITDLGLQRSGTPVHLVHLVPFWFVVVVLPIDYGGFSTPALEAWSIQIILKIDLTAKKTPPNAISIKVSSTVEWWFIIFVESVVTYPGEPRGRDSHSSVWEGLGTSWIQDGGKSLFVLRNFWHFSWNTFPVFMIINRYSWNSRLRKM